MKGRKDRDAAVLSYAPIRNPPLAEVTYCGPKWCKEFGPQQTPSGIKIGIADAKEMGVVPIDRSRNTVVLQMEVDSVKDFFAHLEQPGRSITFGPSFDEKGAFWFGGFSDPEGNPCWVVDKNCP